MTQSIFPFIIFTLSLCICTCYLTNSTSDKTVLRRDGSVRRTQTNPLVSSPSTVIAADDDAFRDRHKEDPGFIGQHHTSNPKNTDTSSPSQSPTSNRCESNGDETYGDITANQFQVSYTYVIEVKPYIFDKLSNEVVPAVAEEVTKSLAKAFFWQCNKMKLRHLQESKNNAIASFVSSTRHGRSLELLGVTTSPTDILNDKNCASYQSVDGSMCAYIKGGMSLYLDDETSQIDAEITANQALAVVRSNMLSGAYLDYYKGIMMMTFLATNETDVNIKPTNKALPKVVEEPSESSDFKPTLLTVGALCIIAVIVSLVVTWKVLKTKHTYREHLEDRDEFSNESSWESNASSFEDKKRSSIIKSTVWAR